MLNFLLCLIALCWYAELTNGCSCMWNHPQTDICQPNSFVALVRIQDYKMIKLVERHQDTTLYRKLNKSKRDSLAVISQIDRRDNYIIEDKQKLDTESSKLYDEIVNRTEMEKTNYPWNYRIRYRIKLYRAYKGLSDHAYGKECKNCGKSLKLHEKLYVYTPVDEGLCGIQLKLKETYLLIGDIFEDRLTVNLCNHIIRWSRLTLDEKRAIRKNMNEVELACNAGCQVVSCNHGSCKPQKSTQCTWSKSLHERIGHKEPANLICTPKSEERCVWSGSSLHKAHHPNRIRRHHKAKRRFLKRHKDFPAP